MKLILKKEIRSKLWPYLGSVLLFLLLSFVKALIQALPKGTFESLKSQPLLILLGISLLVILILSFIIILSAFEPKYTLKDAVYWDKNNQPHCPACKTPIIFTATDGTRNETTYHCMKCMKYGFANGIHR